MHLLLLSHDVETVTAFRRSSGEMGVQLYLCEEARDARSALREHRYDAVAIDCDDTYAGRAVLKTVRQAPSNRRTVVLAIVNGDTHGADAIDMGANLVVSKPVSSGRAREELQRLRGLVGADQRRFPRYPAEGTVYLSFGHAIDRRAWKQPDLLAAPYGGGGKVFVEARLEADIVRLEETARLPERVVVAAKGRAAIT